MGATGLTRHSPATSGPTAIQPPPEPAPAIVFSLRKAFQYPASGLIVPGGKAISSDGVTHSIGRAFDRKNGKVILTFLAEKPPIIERHCVEEDSQSAHPMHDQIRENFFNSTIRQAYEREPPAEPFTEDDWKKLMAAPKIKVLLDNYLNSDAARIPLVLPITPLDQASDQVLSSAQSSNKNQTRRS